MKTINDIYEVSVLSDIEDQLNAGDAAIEQQRKKDFLDIFDFKRDGGISIVISTHVNNIIVTRNIFKEQCCSLDSDNVLTIDFTKIKESKKLKQLEVYPPSITIYNEVKNVSKIKIIDIDTRKDQTTLTICAKNFDLNKIDKLSNIKNVEFKSFVKSSSNTLTLTDNIISFNADLIKYTDVKFDKIYKNKWPNCKLIFNKATWLNILNDSIFNNRNLEEEHVTSKLIVT